MSTTNTAANVTAGKPAVAGAIYTALVSSGATLPTNTTSTLTGFDSVGYLSEDGVTRAQEIGSESIPAWGGDIVLRTRTSKDTTFTFKMIEYLNETVQKVVYGASNVTGTVATGLTVKDKPAFEGEDRSWVIDQVMTNGTKSRIVIPCASITSVGEITYADAEVAGYEITLGTIPDSSGVTVYEYLGPTSAGSSGTSGT